MKHIEKAETKHLDKIISDLREGKYVIPDFQREFEWNPWDVNDLIKSIFMDYYIGTLLLWKASDKNVKILSCEKIKGYTGKINPEQIVLDGQQRLTALYFALFNPEISYPKRKSRCYFFMNIKALVSENYEESFFYEWETKKYKEFINNTKSQYAENIFPLQIIGKGTWEMMDWLKGYETFWKNAQDEHSQIETTEFTEDEKNEYEYKNLKIQDSINLVPEITKILRELLSDYYISYIQLDKEISVAKVCDIFTHINSKGIPLSIFDLLNAILRPHDIFLKDMWRNVSEKLAYTDSDKMKIYIFQVMSILKQTYCSPKYLYYLVPEVEKVIKDNGVKKKITLIKSKEEFENKWNEAVTALEKSIKTLKNPRDFGAINSSFVPYPSIIPVFTAIKKHVEEYKYKNILDINSKIKKWYWSSIFTLNYSSSVESTSAKDFIDIKKWFADDTKEPEHYIEFIKDFDNLRFNKQKAKGSALYNAVFNLLILNGARDWYTSELPEYETLDDHHIVPHSWGKKHIGQDINSILNKTPLSPSTNRHIINNRMPNEYLQEMRVNNGKDKFNGILQTHLISSKAADILMRKPFSKDDYYEFIEEREKTIKTYIKFNIIDEVKELPKELNEINKEIEKLEFIIRKEIASKLNGELENFIPQHIKDKVSRRIENTIRKHPNLDSDNFKSSLKRLEYFDLQEYCDVITNKQIWHIFEPKFKNKPLVMEKFRNLGELRNGIRHSREITEVAKLEGRAALVWLNEILKEK